MLISQHERVVRTCAAGTLLAGTVALQLFLPPPAAAQANKPASTARELLTPQSFPEFHKLIGPQPGEFRWEQVRWVASLWDARKKAAAEDKPIFVFGTNGAGFNDPLGNC
jgi:hypothetical protein